MRTPAVIALFALALTACSKNEGGSGSSQGLTQNWDIDGATTVMQEDKGTKREFVCDMVFTSAIGAQYKVAPPTQTEDIPKIQLRKVSATEVAVSASTPELASKIVKAVGWGHTDSSLCYAKVALGAGNGAPNDLNDTPMLAAYYQALSGQAPDYEQIVDMETRIISNAFEKAKAMDAFKAGFAQQLARAKANAMVTVPLQAGRGIEHYNLETKSFALPYAFTRDRQIQFSNSDYQLVLIGAPRFQAFKPATEEEARKLEDAISNYEANFSYLVHAKIIGFGANSANQKLVIAEVSGLDAVDDNGKTRFSIR